jgi:hypothetical protein
MCGCRSNIQVIMAQNCYEGICDVVAIVVLSMTMWCTNKKTTPIAYEDIVDG